LYGALLSACQSGVGRRVLHQNYRRVLVKWIQDYEGAFTELALLGQKTWNDDEIKKHRFVQNAQNIGLVDTVFEEVISDKSFIETYSQFP
jgi:hypothetical protein